jgi:DNA polymerase-3 subunit delta
VKLGGRDAARFLARPDPGTAGALLYGPDPMRTALKRQALVEALIGPEGAAEMRLTRLPASDLRRDPAALLDALKAVGFFPGPRAVLVEDASDAQGAPIAGALKGLAGPATPPLW